ncbi:orotidine-5'-phosphate decarboxylase [Desulfonatronum sp. SC1]|uniref:orotidine-5'-phosphate decarboxylase n=1 Tax=Desulfonatronum sp. SC1 TaxID=2109626 RepID=UPI000D30F1E9|nr:orotidine-5'-phosphate decarboxylase [Desulfonatronum sp. SC1]PTN36089.1 orotidine-5'-phosphate decarboxylase [Desulfonatronum sp. SC1]
MAQLIIALDTPDLESALLLVDRLHQHTRWFKVGLELFSAVGPRVVEAVRSRDCNVFLDLKFLDIPNTVQSAVRAVSSLGVNMLTVHLSGGRRMVQAALEGVHQGTPSAVSPPLVVGVTMLTSLNQEDLSWMTKPGEKAVPDPGDLAIVLAEHGRRWGVDGVVCSPLEVSRIKSLTDPLCICVTPGIRMPSDGTPELAKDDQSRTLTPAEAVAVGSDYLVVGRPITRASDPARAAEFFLQSMAATIARRHPWPNVP